jgi:MoaA/NifB/PqqE/SkfB family radical SAM enzyme
MTKAYPTLNDAGFAIVGIEVDNRCNMACTFCPLPIREAADASLDLSDVENILDQVAADGTVDLVTFHQFNEPMMYPRIWDCLDMAHARGLRTLLITNGATLNKRNIDKLLEHSPTMLRISAQYIQEDHHNEVRGYKGKFSTYLGGIADCMAALIDRPHTIKEIQCDLAIQQKFVDWKQKLAVATGMRDHGDPTIFDATPESLKPALASFLKMVEDRSKVFTYDEAKHDANIAASRDVWQGAFDLAYQLTDAMVITYKQFINGRRIRDYHPVQYGRCNNTNLAVLANGDVTICCYDYEGFTAIGNVKRDPLGKILADGKAVMDNLHKGGKIHCEGCKRCLGSPTRLGAFLRSTRNFLRYGGDNSNRPLPKTVPFGTLRDDN